MLKTKNENEKILRRLEYTVTGTIDRPSLKEREEKLLEYQSFLTSFEEEARNLFSRKAEIELSRFLKKSSTSTSEVEEKIKALNSKKRKFEKFDFEKEKIKLENAKIEFEQDLANLVSQLKNEKLLKYIIGARKERREFSVSESDRYESRVIVLSIISFGEEWLLKHY